MDLHVSGQVAVAVANLATQVADFGLIDAAVFEPLVVRKARLRVELEATLVAVPIFYSFVEIHVRFQTVGSLEPLSTLLTNKILFGTVFQHVVFHVIVFKAFVTHFTSHSCF